MYDIIYIYTESLYCDTTSSNCAVARLHIQAAEEHLHITFPGPARFVEKSLGVPHKKKHRA